MTNSANREEVEVMCEPKDGRAGTELSMVFSLAAECMFLLAGYKMRTLSSAWFFEC